MSGPTVHLPVALRRRLGRETPRTGRCAETQQIPSSRTLLLQLAPHLVCISSVLFAVCGSGREQPRLMLNHVRSGLPAQCLPGGRGAQLRRPAQEPSSSDQKTQAPGRSEELGRGTDKRLQLFPGRVSESRPRKPASVPRLDHMPSTSSRFVRIWLCLMLPPLSLQPWLLGIVWAGVCILLGYRGMFCVFIRIAHLHPRLELEAERSIRR